MACTGTTHNHNNNRTLHFFLSARNVPLKPRGSSLSTVQDPYIRWSFREGAQGEYTLGGVTKHAVNNSNPDYPESPFSYPWTRGTGQQWKFEILDYDPLSKDDLIAEYEMAVDEYALFGGEQYTYTAKLAPAPCLLLIQRVEPITFRLSARSLPKRDALSGLSDPYVECYWSTGKGAQGTLFTKTAKIRNALDVDWDEVLVFPLYQKGTGQWLSFRVWDKDPLPKDDFLGRASCSADELHAKMKELQTVELELEFRCAPESASAPKLLLTPVDK